MRVVAAVLLLCLQSLPSHAADAVSIDDRRSGLEPAQIETVRAQVAREYAKLKAFFGIDVGPVVVTLVKKGVGRHFPPNRIQIPAAQVRHARAVSAHELTHLLTQGWANGLLKEGLAVYGQDKFGETPAWPNWGQNIHQAAYAEIVTPDTDVRGPGDANRVLSTPNPGKTKLRLAAYRVAGSWVTWLIDERMSGDVRRFVKTVYRSGSYKKALGETFQELRPAWKAYVKARR